MSGDPPSRASLLGNGALLSALILLAAWLATLQKADWPMLNPMVAPRIWACVATMLFVALCAVSWRSARRRARTTAGVKRDTADWLLLHASQSGMAVEFAELTAMALSEAGYSASVMDIAQWDPAVHVGGRCLFFASTTGEGDPPDPALGFATRVMSQSYDLSGLHYAVMALGDRGYSNFCAFGRQLDAWLQSQQAVPLFDRVEVDNADPDALRDWQCHVQRIAGTGVQGDWSTPRHESWILSSRHLLNPGSAGGALYHLALTPASGAEWPAWQAGDIAEIRPRHASRHLDQWMAAAGMPIGTMRADASVQRMLRDVLSRSRLPLPENARGLLTPETLAASLQPLPNREYSIASLPEDGRLELVVRLMRDESGLPGIGSGWLCEHANVGDTIDLRIRRNPGFHRMQSPCAMILIGNGTGIAGLRAHLRERIAAGETRNWLVYGERNAGIDAPFDAELNLAFSNGRISHLDRTYSREGHPIRYVQHQLLARRARLLAWVEEGAAIYVCGSRDGMASGVHAALIDILGETRVDAMLESGMYRRDVY